MSRLADGSVAAATGRADLVRALVQDGEDGLAAMARFLGYEPTRRKKARRAPQDANEPRTTGQVSADPGALPVGAAPSAFLPVPFWRPVAVELNPAEGLTIEPQAPPKSRQDLRESDLEPDAEAERGEPEPIVAWPRLWRVLDDRLRTSTPRSEIDARELVTRWARGENVEPLPRLEGLAHSRLLVILDQSPPLMPFRIDQVRLAGELLRRLGPASARFAVVSLVHRTESAPITAAADERVLALSDLGSYGGEERAAFWQQLGLRLKRSHVSTLALVPCPASRWPQWAVDLWSALEWSTPARAPGPRVDRPSGSQADPVEALICLASPAIRLETGLVRDLRQLIPEADVDTEADLRGHGAVASSSLRGLSLKQDEARRRLADFVKLPEATQRAVIEILRSWHEALAPEIWAEEVAGLLAQGVPEDWLGAETVGKAVVLVDKISTVVERGEGELAAETETWFGRFAGRTSGAVWADRRFREPLARALAAWRRRNADAVQPAGVTPEMFESSLGQDVDAWAIWQEGAGFRVRRHGELGEGSWVASVRSRQPKILVADGVSSALGLDLGGEAPFQPFPESGRPIDFVTDMEAVRLGLWEPPEWASASGRDVYGLWASFEVDGVEQRMRWIPPGHFRMGSPESESGRWDDEGPRHWVVLTEGFWLAETPCTQALWEAVTGANPSQFVSPRRPVEQVSWEDCQEFLDRLNGRSRGLEVWLPTEAEWEYACRAGTDTATWLGDSGGAEKDSLLDQIAWYDGSDGTQEVGMKRPNPWGLYDVLGNVLEWCWDRSANYGSELTIDPEGPEGGAGRVFRGGSWDDHARHVRAAYRFADHPGDRYDNLGFRLARGQGRGAPGERASAGAERVGRGTSPRRRSRRSIAWVERLGWAVDGGVDPFGRWASFEVDGVVQRMRWIVPGRFQMGSPETEAGRWDDEGPRHWVTLTEGFWLSDTPCTQELWAAVIRQNPSEFVSPRRPVEQVSWEECQQFFERLNARLPELGAGFPTEAQWEYACRAGTETATWLGDLEILGERNAPLLDKIAWYGGNSGVHFELESGYDSADWTETQYPHTRAGTREVGRKRSNPWGLYDMLGNVDEWCSDYWAGTYPGGPRTDPTGPEGGAKRVFRGGSWRGRARGVRAAFRDAARPGDRFDFLGFRLARGQGRVE